MKSLRLILLHHVLPPLVLFGLALLLWAAVVQLTGIEPYLLPGPVRVAQAAVAKAGPIASGMLLTGAAAIAGFGMSLVVGVSVAILFAESTWLRRGGYPYAIFLQTVPIVAIAPLIINLLGPGWWGVIVVANVISVFPFITNTTSGLLSVPNGLVELFQLNRASRWQTLIKLRLPAAIPAIVTGAKTSAGLAVVGAIVGEFFTSYGATRHGLGYLILQAIPQLRTDELFAEVFASALLGVCIFFAVSMCGDILLKKWTQAE